MAPLAITYGEGTKVANTARCRVLTDGLVEPPSGVVDDGTIIPVV